MANDKDYVKKQHTFSISKQNIFFKLPPPNKDKLFGHFLKN